MKKGIIMEINKRFLTILTPDGEFLRARNLNKDVQIGQEIDFFPVEQNRMSNLLSFSRFKPRKGRFVISTALALVLLMISILPSQLNNQVYAYMSIDINPSIELGVNKKDQVIEMIPYNQDGEKIVSRLKNWKHEDVKNVLSDIFNEISNQGYLKENHEVVLSTVFVKEDSKERAIHLQKEMAKDLNEMKEFMQNEDLDVTVVNGTSEDRKEAIEQGLTTGLYKKAKRKTEKKETKVEENQKKETKIEENQKIEDNKMIKENKKIEVPIQQPEQPQQPQQVNPINQQEERTKVKPNKQTDNIENNKGSTSSIPPGQLKKVEISDENGNKANEVKTEPPKNQKIENNTSNGSSPPKETNINSENNGNHNNQAVPENKSNKK